MGLAISSIPSKFLKVFSIIVIFLSLKNALNQAIVDSSRLASKQITLFDCDISYLNSIANSIDF